MSGEKQLIDCRCNGGVYNLGHRNAEIIQALVQRLDELDIGNHDLISAPRATLTGPAIERVRRGAAAADFQPTSQWTRAYLLPALRHGFTADGRSDRRLRPSHPCAVD